MAIFHVSKNTPTKAEVLADWLPKQAWGPEPGAEIERIGSFHFDDPEGEVGMETHVVTCGGTVFQIPLTYRDAPLADAEDSFVATLEHSVLGTRWIYDALGDDQFLCVLAGVALTGQGHALGMASFDGRWYAVPEEIRLSGGGGDSSLLLSTASPVSMSVPVGPPAPPAMAPPAMVGCASPTTGSRWRTSADRRQVKRRRSDSPEPGPAKQIRSSSPRSARSDPRRLTPPHSTRSFWRLW